MICDRSPVVPTGLFVCCVICIEMKFVSYFLCGFECYYRPIHGDVNHDSNCNGIYVSVAL